MKLIFIENIYSTSKSDKGDEYLLYKITRNNMYSSIYEYVCFLQSCHINTIWFRGLKNVFV